MKTVYQAYNGKIFKTKEECENFEKNFPPRIYIDGFITKVVRKKVVDETGIHYPIREIIVEEKFGFDMHSTYFNVHLPDRIRPEAMKRIAKGSLVRFAGHVFPTTKLIKGNSVVTLNVKDVRFEFIFNSKLNK